MERKIVPTTYAHLLHKGTQPQAIILLAKMITNPTWQKNPTVLERLDPQDVEHPIFPFATRLNSQLRLMDSDRRSL